MKKLLVISLLMSVFSISLVEAATTDFVADGNVTISTVTYGSLTADLLVMNGSKAESIAVGNGNFSVTNPDSAAGFFVGSSNATARSIRVQSAGSSFELACANNTTPGTSYVAVPAVGVYAIYPSGDLCTTNSSLGSGGGSKKPKAPKELPQVPATPTPASSALSNASSNAAFNRSLLVGSIGEDVRNLQKFLNGKGFTVAPSGPGSTGKETNVFGAATRAALIKFQLANGIIFSASEVGAGNVGPKTRTELNKTTAPASVTSEDKAALIQSLTVKLQDLINQFNALKAKQGN